MRKLLHTAFIFILLALFTLGRDDAVTGGLCQNGTRAFPSAAGYYFSRRIFPQMNFMKTVFALLINRSSAAAPFLFARGERISREAVGAAFSNNIVSETARSRKSAVARFSSLFSATGFPARYMICVIYANPLRTPPTSLFFFLFAMKGRLEKLLASR